MGDPTHDKGMRARPDGQGGIRTRGTPWIYPTHGKVKWKDLTGKTDQDTKDPLAMLKHLPQNQKLSVLLFHVFHQHL